MKPLYMEVTMTKKTILSLMVCFIGLSAVTALSLSKKNKKQTATELPALKSEELIRSLNASDISTKKLQANFAQSFMDRETAMWEDIGTKTDFSQNFVQKEGNGLARSMKASGSVLNYEYRAGGKKPSKKVVKLVHEVARDCGISPEDIEIVSVVNKLPTSAASANGNVVSIDERYFNDYPRNEQKFVLAHELCHVIQNDSCTNHVLKNTISRKAKDLTGKEREDLLKAVSRFQEERADAFSLSRGKEYVDGGVAFCKQMVDQFGDRTGSYHPKWSQRLRLAQSFVEVSVA